MPDYKTAELFLANMNEFLPEALNIEQAVLQAVTKDKRDSLQEDLGLRLRMMASQYAFLSQMDGIKVVIEQPLYHLAYYTLGSYTYLPQAVKRADALAYAKSRYSIPVESGWKSEDTISVYWPDSKEEVASYHLVQIEVWRKP
jgi:hypothetical protein